MFTPPPPSSSTSSSSTLTTTKLKTLLHNLILSRISRFFSKLKSAISHAMEDIHLSHYFTSSSDQQLDRITKNNNYKSHIKKKILYGSFRLHYNWCSSKSNNSHTHILPPLNYTTAAAAHDNISSTITSHLMDEFGKSSRRSKNSWGSTSSQRICHDYCNSNSSSFTDYRSCDESFQIPSKRLEDDGATTTTTKVVDDDDVVFGEQQLSNYLQWLEEKNHHQGGERKNYTSSSSRPQKQEKDKDVLKMMNQIDKLADMFIADCHEKFRLEKIESYRRQTSKNIISSY